MHKSYRASNVIDRYWEIVILIRKVCLELILLGFRPFGRLYQASGTIVLITIFLVAEYAYSPYMHLVPTYLERGAMIIQIISYFLLSFPTVLRPAMVVVVLILNFSYVFYFCYKYCKLYNRKAVVKRRRKSRISHNVEMKGFDSNDEGRGKQGLTLDQKNGNDSDSSEGSYHTEGHFAELHSLTDDTNALHIINRFNDEHNHHYYDARMHNKNKSLYIVKK